MKFKCKNCGSVELVFSSYAKCQIPVVINEDLTIEYLEPIINSDDYIQHTAHYCCPDCGLSVGDYIRTEQELLVNGGAKLYHLAGGLKLYHCN